MERYINASSEYSIVIRRSALVSKNIQISQLNEAFENATPLGTNEELLSYGPHFGYEAMENIGKRLTDLGLDYIDDFFYFFGDFPDWATFFVSLTTVDK